MARTAHKIITATEHEVRAHFEREGFEVRISRDGRVVFRRRGYDWQDGRYVAEYRVIDGRVMPQ